MWATSCTYEHTYILELVLAITAILGFGSRQASRSNFCSVQSSKLLLVLIITRILHFESVFYWGAFRLAVYQLALIKFVRSFSRVRCCWSSQHSHSWFRVPRDSRVFGNGVSPRAAQKTPVPAVILSLRVYLLL
jgi:hypothetical protein